MSTHLIECLDCMGEGYCYTGPDPEHDYRWTCETCHGSGAIEEEAVPRTLDDLIEEDEEIFPRTLEVAIDVLNQACAKYPPPPIRHRLISVEAELALMERAFGPLKR